MKRKPKIIQGPIKHLKYIVYEIDGQEVEFEEQTIAVLSAPGDVKRPIFVNAPVDLENKQLIEALDLLKQELLNESN